jgi:predicted  nucleic acid-binding Zn-ribbon protein
MMDGTSYWVESLEEPADKLTDDEARRQLEVEVSTLKRELAEVRKELAAKVRKLHYVSRHNTWL